MGPQDERRLLTLADARRLSGDRREAEEALGRARAANPRGSAWASYFAGLAAMTSRDDVTLARSDAEQAIQLQPGHGPAHVLLIRSLLAVNDVASARRWTDALLSTYPGHTEGRALRVAIETGRPPAPPIVALEPTPPEEAAPPPVAAPQVPEARPAPGPDSTEADAQRQARLEAMACHDDANCWARRGAEAMERGDVGRARTQYLRAQELEPGNPEVNAGLGAIYLDSGNAGAAVRHLQAAAAANYSDSAIMLGQAYRTLGQTEQARRAYQQYLDQHPGGRYVTAAQRGLASLGPASQPSAEPPAPESDISFPDPPLP
jgi:tetratricopeptide (TPR) repeat protein